MKIKSNEGHVGIITLLNGEVFNYRIKRYIIKTDTLVFYTGKALNELFKINAQEEEKILSNKVLEYVYSENEFKKLGYIGKVKMSEVASYI